MKETKQETEERAAALFAEGFHCSQAVLHACSGLFREEAPPSELTAAMVSFAGGIGQSGRVCGALTGALATIGFTLGKTEPKGKNHRILDRLNQEMISEFHRITKKYGDFQAVDNLNLTVARGEIFGFLGPNGAGKTTMLNVINGVYTPDEGRIFFEGEQRPLKMKPHHIADMGIARTFQNLALFKGMDTWNNIMVGRTKKMKSNFFSQGIYWGMSQKEEIEHRKAVEWIIDFLEIENIRKQPVGMLPYGLQKRVELGRALAAEPKLLLLDEPMAGMNLEEKEDIARFVLDANEELGWKAEKGLEETLLSAWNWEKQVRGIK